MGLLLGISFSAIAQSPLCASYPTTFCCEYVSSVTINGVTRAGAPDATGFTSGPGYFDYTGEILTTMTAGTTVPVSVTEKPIVLTRNMLNCGLILTVIQI